MPTQELLDGARESLTRVQAYDASKLGREAQLGALNFRDAIGPAQEIVSTFQRINTDALNFFSTSQLNLLKNQADGFFNLLQAMTNWDLASSSNARGEQQSFIDQMKNTRDSVVDSLAALISYSLASSLDLSSSQQQVRAVLQAFADERQKALDEISKVKSEADAVLARVRDAAAEQGVSQQAVYFQSIAAEHAAHADTWLKYSLIAGGVALGFALVAALTYRIPWLAPLNVVEAAQLITSKVLILGILGYAVVVCVRNFQSHKHNNVVNKHRQNALLTYTAFVDAAPSTASREIVLTHAAASVFAPQDTGLIKAEEPVGGRSIMEMITKASMQEGKG